MVIGGVLSAVGFTLSRLVRQIWLLFVTFGFISGIGLSMTFTGAVVAVTYYFDRRRALATGLTGKTRLLLRCSSQITVCGTGLGTAVFAPLVDFLLSVFKWNGALLWLGGILGMQVLCGEH